HDAPIAQLDRASDCEGQTGREASVTSCNRLPHEWRTCRSLHVIIEDARAETRFGTGLVHIRLHSEQAGQTLTVGLRETFMKLTAYADTRRWKQGIPLRIPPCIVGFGRP